MKVEWTLKPELEEELALALYAQSRSAQVEDSCPRPSLAEHPRFSSFAHSLLLPLGKAEGEAAVHDAGYDDVDMCSVDSSYDRNSGD
jgi:hypothetical protein